MGNGVEPVDLGEQMLLIASNARMNHLDSDDTVLIVIYFWQSLEKLAEARGDGFV